MTERFPLAWPAGRPRTKARVAGKFSMKGDDGWQKDISVPVAIERLERELKLLDARYPLISSNIEVRLNGSLVLNKGEPADPGVCVYFQLDGKSTALPCDRYRRIADNLAALAAHIEATRAITRHGVASSAETLMAFLALPPSEPPKPKWWVALRYTAGEPARADVDADLIGMLYRRAAKAAGQDEGRLREVNQARDEALTWLGVRRLS